MGLCLTRDDGHSPAHGFASDPKRRLFRGLINHLMPIIDQYGLAVRGAPLTFKAGTLHIGEVKANDLNALLCEPFSHCCHERAMHTFARPMSQKECRLAGLASGRE
ncbi:hypothetical protein BFW38_01125 [Terasakiispira papahanaumokuakeensis]|uniref:Uncharacterized protein n=1 Tax=Terasakiispira papahanaumokuakeensis TaxID=197479 RepID=A0A1E2V5S2_9GAMM|nr:hypothetical protein BFW38_01125 [Terasakiispira papahanaumokuakeensis]